MAWVDDECNVKIKAGTHQPKTFSTLKWFSVDVCNQTVELLDLRTRR